MTISEPRSIVKPYQKTPEFLRLEKCLRGQSFSFHHLDDQAYRLGITKPERAINLDGLTVYIAGRPELRVIERSNGNLIVTGPKELLVSLIEKFCKH